MLTALALPAHMGGPGFGFIFAPLIALFWIGVVILIVSIARRRGFRGGWGHNHPYWNPAARSAEATLAERFAQGDIDEQEYRARLEVLRANNPAAPYGR